jgi:hypothetical protein
MYRQRRPFNEKGNKFNAKSQDYGGFRYDSKKEAAYAMELDWRKKAGEVKDWQRQVKVPLKVNGILIANYYCDFRVELSNGIIQYHEVKGLVMPLWEMKWKLFQALIDEIEPGAELIVIK